MFVLTLGCYAPLLLFDVVQCIKYRRLIASFEQQAEAERTRASEAVQALEKEE